MNILGASCLNMSATLKVFPRSMLFIIIVCIFFHCLLKKAKNVYKDNVPCHGQKCVFWVLSPALLKSMSTHTVIFKDDPWSLNFVPHSSLSNHGLSLFHSSLREKPARRLWDEPATVINRERERLRFDEKLNTNKSVTFFKMSRIIESSLSISYSWMQITWPWIHLKLDICISKYAHFLETFNREWKYIKQGN